MIKYLTKIYLVPSILPFGRLAYHYAKITGKVSLDSLDSAERKIQQARSSEQLISLIQQQNNMTPNIFSKYCERLNNFYNGEKPNFNVKGMISRLKNINYKQLTGQQFSHCLGICAAADQINITQWTLMYQLFEKAKAAFKNSQQFSMEQLINYYKFFSCFEKKNMINITCEVLHKKIEAQKDKVLVKDYLQLIRKLSKKSILLLKERNLAGMLFQHFSTQIQKQKLELSPRIKLYCYCLRLQNQQFFGKPQQQLKKLTTLLQKQLLEQIYEMNEKNVTYLLLNLQKNQPFFNKLASELYASLDSQGNTDISAKQYSKYIRIISEKRNVFYNDYFFNCILKFYEIHLQDINYSYSRNFIQMIYNDFFSNSQLQVIQKSFEKLEFLQSAPEYMLKMMTSKISIHSTQKIETIVLSKTPKLLDDNFMMYALLSAQLKKRNSKNPQFIQKYNEYVNQIKDNVPNRTSCIKKWRYVNLDIIQQFFDEFGLIIFNACLDNFRKLPINEQKTYKADIFGMMLYGNQILTLNADKFVIEPSNVTYLLRYMNKSPEKAQKRYEFIDNLIDLNLKKINFDATNEQQKNNHRIFLNLIFDYTICSRPPQNFHPTHSYKLIKFATTIIKHFKENIYKINFEDYANSFISMLKTGQKSSHEYVDLLNLIGQQYYDFTNRDSKILVNEMIAFGQGHDLFAKKWIETSKSQKDSTFRLYFNAILGLSKSIQNIPIGHKNITTTIYSISHYSSQNESVPHQTYLSIKDVLNTIQSVDKISEVLFHFSTDHLAHFPQLEQVYQFLISKLTSEIRKLNQIKNNKKAIKIFQLIQTIKKNLSKPEVTELWKVLCDYVATTPLLYSYSIYSDILRINEQNSCSNDLLNRRIFKIIKEEMRCKHIKDPHQILTLLFRLSKVQYTLKNFTLNLPMSLYINNKAKMLAYFQYSLVQVDQGKLDSLARFLMVQPENIIIRPDLYRYFEVKSQGKLDKYLKKIKTNTYYNPLIDQINNQIVHYCKQKGIAVEKITEYEHTILKVREKYLSISSSQVPIAHKKIHFDFIETIFSDKVKLNNKMDNFDVIFIRGMKTKQIRSAINQKIEGINLDQEFMKTHKDGQGQSKEIEEKQEL